MILTLEETFKGSYVRGIGTAVHSQFGRVMWSDDLDLINNTLTIQVYSRPMEGIHGPDDEDQCRIYKKDIQLTDDIFESKTTVAMNLDTVISTVQYDLIHL